MIRGEEVAMRVVECEKDRYEDRAVPYGGKVYSWRPERVRFECGCGEMLAWTAPVTLCVCGASYTDVVSREPQERRADAEAYRPWLEEYEEWRRRKPASNLRHEYFEYFGFARTEGDD